MSLEFTEKNLNEIYTITSGLSKSSDEFGFGFPFLSFKTIFYNYYIHEDLDELVNSTEEEQKKHSVKKGDVFLTRTSETLDELGMSCVALRDYPNATFNGFTKRLRPKKDNIIYPLYACYYFRSTLFRKYVDSMAIMTTRASLNNNILSKLPIIFPNYEDQKKTVVFVGYNQDIVNTPTDDTFIGYFRSVTKGGNELFTLNSAGQYFCPFLSDLTKQFRAYIIPTTDMQCKKYSVTHDDILSVYSTSINDVVDVYDLNGMLIHKNIHKNNLRETLKNGTYIINNRKYIIR